jgi:hypothetical protein
MNDVVVVDLWIDSWLYVVVVVVVVVRCVVVELIHWVSWIWWIDDEIVVVVESWKSFGEFVNFDELMF